jgi:hypothetical protein
LRIPSRGRSSRILIWKRSSKVLVRRRSWGSFLGKYPQRVLFQKDPRGSLVRTLWPQKKTAWMQTFSPLIGPGLWVSGDYSDIDDIGNEILSLSSISELESKTVIKLV